ncbi:MAG: hypothetical protein ACRDU8_00020 [Egibacteraceae bacterium]
MTASAELRAQAAAKSDEAERLRGIAADAAAKAGEIPSLLDVVAGSMTTDTWSGSAAQQAFEQLSQLQGGLGSAQTDVEDACERILDEARALEAEADELSQQADVAAEREASERGDRARDTRIPI